ncbi:MAG: Gfo/Idh/MocA family oxidoreductase [Tepidisphaeraceae bacterium]
MQTSRRSFLKSSSMAAGSLALSAAPAILNGQTTKSGVKHTVALLGCGWWGTNILGAALKDGRVKVVGLCDVDAAQIKKCAENIGKLTSDTPRTYVDYRELLEKEKPQLVIVGTPDHWHPLMMIAAVRAGAHVYVEKPIGHTVLEGAAMVKAARDSGRIVQVGTHRRVSPHNLSAREFIRSGKVGTIGEIKCFVNGGGEGPEKPQANEEPPADLNWDLWCGPAPLRPFNKKIHTRGHRQFLDFANGQLGDWGIHWLDQVLWIMERHHPTTVFSTGGRPIKGAPVNDGKQQTTDAPDHQIATYAFDDFTMTWEHRQFAGDPTSKHQPIGVEFCGTNGVFHLGWLDGWTFYPIDDKQPTVHEDAKFTGEFQDNVPELWKDFVDAIEQNRAPACDIEAGHRATTCALLGMLSLKLGRSVRWDGAKQTILDDPEAAALLKREYRGPWEYPKA